MPDKAAAVLEQFKAAAEKKNTIAEVWETLGELQAEINPPGISFKLTPKS